MYHIIVSNEINVFNPIDISTCYTSNVKMSSKGQSDIDHVTLSMTDPHTHHTLMTLRKNLARP